MNFAPTPTNDFAAFFSEYFRRCQARCPLIRVVAAKWRFEDLVPGFSDFDTRFITANGTTPADWSRMSLEVGAVHTEMCLQFPHWARNLEHLPGINLTEAELCDPVLFYPEFQQWTFYAGDEAIMGRITAALAAHRWSPRDEWHHLKKFATFCGPYQRGIDPPVNLGAWENEYALHSRFMHYFAPPVQSAVSLVERRNVPGKLEAIRRARDLFPHPDVIDTLLDAVARHYETLALYEEPELTRLERRLETYLQDAWAALAAHVTLVKPAANTTREEIRGQVNAVPVDPVAAFFEGVKFGRLMKGRLRFYAQGIAWFDSRWLIRNELGRIVANFYTRPLTLYAKLRLGRTMEPAEVLDELRGGLLTAKQCEGMRHFADVAGALMPDGDSAPGAPGNTARKGGATGAMGIERERALAVADTYDPVLEVLERLADDMLEAARRGQPADH